MSSSTSSGPSTPWTTRVANHSKERPSPRIQIQVPKKNKDTTTPKKKKSHNEVVVLPPATKQQRRPVDWPTSSVASLPPLSSHVMERLENDGLDFAVNDECTSLKLVPSGRHLIAGFSDGTLRLFDLTSDHNSNKKNTRLSIQDDEEEELFDFDSDHEDDKKKFYKTSSREVLSKHHMQHGAVLAQIHAKGVHTSLLMHVDVSQDGMYCFGGVSRGSVELVAVDLSKVMQQDSNQKNNVLDLVSVHRHAHAKLKGFGACTRLRNHSLQKYLLLTGRGIKNIHIWSFTPSATQEQWQCLYDTQTNGNSINLLTFRYDGNGLLQGISKSDQQKLRVWDLSLEQHEGNPNHALYDQEPVISGFKKNSAVAQTNVRPKKPPHVDVASTESTKGMAGGFCVCGGGGVMYNQMSVVSLEVENVNSPYNHTDLALPDTSNSSGKRRQQRGELKSIASVAGMDMDAGHVLLELSNGSIVLYSQNHLNSMGLPRLVTLDPGLFPPRPEQGSRQMSLTRVGSQGAVVAAVSFYDQMTGRGNLVLRRLDDKTSPKGGGFWGFDGVVFAKQHSMDKAYKTPHKRTKTGLDSSANPISSPETHPIVTPKPSKKRKNSVSKQTATTKTSSAHCVVDSPDNVLQNGKEEATPVAAGTPLGVKVSPEFKSPVPFRVGQKEDGAMMKFLRPTEKSTQVASSTQCKSVSTKQTQRKSVSSKMLKAKSAGITPPTDLSSGSDKQVALVKEKRSVATKRYDITGRTPKVSKPVKSKKRKQSSHGVEPSSTKKKATVGANNKPVPVAPPKAVKRTRVASTPKKIESPTEETLHDVATALCILQRSPTPKPPRGSHSPKRTPRAAARSIAPKLAAESTTPKTSVRSATPKATARSATLKTAARSTTPKPIARSAHGARPSFLSPNPRRKMPRSLLHKLPKTTVLQRMVTDEGKPRNRGGKISEMQNKKKQESLSRQKLAAQHRACHEMLRKKVLASADSAIRSLVASPPTSLEEARNRLEEDISDYEEMLLDMLGRQRLEASALAATQLFDTQHGDKIPPVLEVSFPFPEVFAHARESFQSFVES